MQLEVLRKLFPENPIIYAYEEYTLCIEADKLHSGLSLLKNHSSCVYATLLDVTAVDYLHFHRVNEQSVCEYAADSSIQSEAAADLRDKRFAVVYNVLSLEHKKRLRVRVMLSLGEAIASVGDLWQSALWAEREVFDMFGITFNGHPELERILTDYGFSGHPLRKDFALQGDYALRYDASAGKVIKETSERIIRADIPKTIRYSMHKDA